jgi:hypothetical protein
MNIKKEKTKNNDHFIKKTQKINKINNQQKKNIFKKAKTKWKQNIYGIFFKKMENIKNIETWGKNFL